MTEQLVTHPDQLHDLVAALTGAEWIALDTEFIRERTFSARLCLLQVATPEVIACIDPLALPSIEPLLDMLYAPTTLKVLHAARQDLEVFWDLRRAVPAPLFDTQIAAALIGFDAQLGYGALVEALTGVRLPKLATRTDWAARPLAPEQLRYAFDDVHYLRDVYLHLEHELERLGRRAWLTEECARMSDPALYRNDPDEAWRRLRAGASLDPAAQTRLRALAAWRERQAQTRDLPRGWIVKDNALVEIARRAPRTLEDLAAIPDLAPGSVRRFGSALLTEIERSRDAPPSTLWPPATRPDEAQQALQRQLAACVQASAAREHIHPSVLATRQDQQELIQSGSGRVLQGWRRTVIGEELLRVRNAAIEA